MPIPQVPSNRTVAPAVDVDFPYPWEPVNGVDDSALGNDWFFTLDHTGTVIRLTAPRQQDTAPLSGVLGHRLFTLIDPDEAEGAMAATALRTRRGFQGLRACVVLPDGIERRVRISATARDGGMRCAVTDVTEFIGLERDLAVARRLERIFRAAMSATPVNLAITDVNQPDGPLIFVNDAFVETTGYPAEEVIGRNCRFLQGPGTDQGTVDAMRRAIAEERRHHCEILNYRKDGTPFWNALDLAPVRGPNGEVEAYVGVQLDVTADRKRRESQQQRQRLESLGRLAGGIAHELNNVLQPALLLPALIAQALPENAVEERGHLTTITESTRQARDVVREVLAFGRRHGAGEEPTPFGPALNGALEFVRNLVPPSVVMRRRGLEAPDLDVPVILSDVGLRQVMTNLILNAADAMERKGVVTISAGIVDDHVEVRVEDTGCGMAPDVLRQAFDPFFTTKSLGAGTGLGLSTVFGMVERWFGSVTASSFPGGGSRFTIRLPIHQASEARLESLSSSSSTDQTRSVSWRTSS